jgi:uncharacterized protein (TIGR02271 family)
LEKQEADKAAVAQRGVAAKVQERRDAASTGASERLELLGERLRAEVVREQPEIVRVHTEVIEHTEQLTVTLHEERLIIETRPGSGRVTVDGKAIEQGGRIEIPLSRERAVVSTEVVPLEDVTIRTERSERREKVDGTVRREELVVEGPQGRVEAAPDGVTVIAP